MYSLEQEYVELSAAGVIDETVTSRSVALERGTIFSVFEELRFALYAAVAAITTGIGILLKENLNRIGPVTLITALALVAGACYGTAIRSRLRQETRTIGGDYLLLLGALIMSADLGYAESQFHWFGPHWSWNLLILAALHAAGAYALNSRLVLSASLASLAGWFGVEGHVSTLFQLDGSLSYSGIQAMVCAGVILLWREIHRRQGGAPQFEGAFEHFAANIGFWAALALTLSSDTRYAGVAVLVALAVASIRKGMQESQEVFVIYGIAYTAGGLCYLEAQIIGEGLFAALVELATVIAAVILLWRFHQKLKVSVA
jgi:general stress protein CsbA